ncbi:30S ribosomal protein S9 [Candidatus Peregrinibacteria bacterium]|jgi:small subunit ribosomal protein S9|nr:30S ribosomal protein S9 [Candidatus Peregrinibacteria bacterium]MBT4631653.1 30S ribosomal protein S9 [Candidatus Peregrinibacteria bacterium]MBT5516781.1 30S ribosomal protein S9 [Candidatus Peregrinibacteria bacterium]MBT5823937.1 30S ribosomal protein S9 [Candidatus Peregrinibacteria bacterium]
MSEATKFTGTYFYANGKRKRSVARVRLYKGTGRIIVNEMDAKAYFGEQEPVNVLVSPLILTKQEKQFDISVKVIGGGKSSQAQSIRHGISKALVVADAENRAILKPEGYLTRDSRIRERKKFGLRRARRAPQFSKR